MALIDSRLEFFSDCLTRTFIRECVRIFFVIISTSSFRYGYSVSRYALGATARAVLGVSDSDSCATGAEALQCLSFELILGHRHTVPTLQEPRAARRGTQ